MLKKEPKQRPNLRELIQSLTSLKKMVNMMNQNLKKDETCEQLNQVIGRIRNNFLKMGFYTSYGINIFCL